MLKILSNYYVYSICSTHSKRKQQQRSPPPPPPLPEGCMYQTSGKTVEPNPNYPHQPPPPPHMDMTHYKDRCYNTAENEYAYISEVPPPPPPSYTTQSSTFAHKHMELYKAHRCDYGTNAHGQTPTKQSKDSRKINADNAASVRYVDSKDMPLPDPPTYFELDPEAQSARPQVGDNRGNMAANHAQEDVHYNQSVADFPASTYDHLVDRNGTNSNHKSV